VDEDHHYFQVPDGAIFTPDGVLFILPEGGAITRNTDGTYEIPPGTDVYHYYPPMHKVVTVGAMGGTYDPKIPAIIMNPAEDGIVYPICGVVFYANGGTVEGGTFKNKHPANGYYALPERPVRENYLFIGWYAERHKYDISQTSMQITQDTPYGSYSPYEVFAHWQLIGKLLGGVVFFYLDDNAAAVDDDYATGAITYGDFYAFPENPTRDKHEFLGWYIEGTDIEVTTNWIFSVVSPKKLVARWRCFCHDTDDEDLPVVITEIKMLDGNAPGEKMVYLKVKAADDTPDSHKLFIISLVGTPDLNTPFTPVIPTYDPETMDVLTTPTIMRVEGCTFCFPQPHPGAYFFRAIATPVIIIP